MSRIATGLLALAVVAGAACGKGGNGSAPPPSGPQWLSSIPDTFSVFRTLPEDQATGVSQTQTVYLQVNETLDPSTINTNNITISQGSNPPLTATVNYVPSWGYVSIKASGNLNPSTPYTVRVSAGLKNTLGASVNPKAITFTTSNTGDTVAPVFGGVSTAAKVGTATHPFGINLTWTQAPETSISYDIYVTTVPGEYYFIPEMTVTDVASAIVDLGTNTSYTCRVQARDAAGNTTATVSEFSATTEISFQHNVWPTMSTACASCHSGQTSLFYNYNNTGNTPVWDQWTPPGFPSHVYDQAPLSGPMHTGYWAVQSMSMATPAQAYLNMVDSAATMNYDGTGATVTYIPVSGEPSVAGMKRIARTFPGGVPTTDLPNTFIWQRLTTNTWSGQLHLGNLTLQEQSSFPPLFQTWLTQGAKFN